MYIQYIPMNRYSKCGCNHSTIPVQVSQILGFSMFILCFHLFEQPGQGDWVSWYWRGWPVSLSGGFVGSPFDGDGYPPRYVTRHLLAMPIIDFEGSCLGVIQAINKHHGGRGKRCAFCWEGRLRLRCEAAFRSWLWTCGWDHVEHLGGASLCGLAQCRVLSCSHHHQRTCQCCLAGNGNRENDLWFASISDLESSVFYVFWTEALLNMMQSLTHDLGAQSLILSVQDSGFPRKKSSRSKSKC